MRLFRGDVIVTLLSWTERGDDDDDDYHSEWSNRDQHNQMTWGGLEWRRSAQRVSQTACSYPS